MKNRSATNRIANPFVEELDEDHHDHDGNEHSHLVARLLTATPV
jgi:hypothetical protein